MPMTEDGYVQGDGWCAGVDFDPHDPEEMEIMTVIFDNERACAIAKLQRENDRLLTRVDELRTKYDPEYEHYAG